MTKRFILCIDRFDAPDGAIWAVRQGNKWYTAQHVDVRVPVITVFRGKGARQPKAYLSGYGTVRQISVGLIIIYPAGQDSRTARVVVNPVST